MERLTDNDGCIFVIKSSKHIYPKEYTLKDTLKDTLKNTSIDTLKETYKDISKVTLNETYKDIYKDTFMYLFTYLLMYTVTNCIPSARLLLSTGTRVRVPLVYRRGTEALQFETVYMKIYIQRCMERYIK